MRTAVLVLLVLAAATGCGSDDQQAAPPPSQPTATTETPAQARELAPALAGTSLEGEAISLDDFRGRPVLVNVWSSW